MRQGEDDVEVAGGQDLVFSAFKPAFTRHVLAFGTMAISARMIANAHGAAVGAAINMAAEISGAAVQQVKCNFIRCWNYYLKITAILTKCGKFTNYCKVSFFNLLNN